MEHNISAIIELLLVACVVAMAARWGKYPYTIALVLVGLAIGLSKLAPSIYITQNITFTLILPPLLFQGAMHVDLEDLKNNWASITMLAVPGVICSTVIIGLIIHHTWGIGLLYALLFGALMTPTDPISVLAILKKVAAPKRLRVILEGESLFNDGTGVVVFTVILGMLTAHTSFSAGHSLIKFLTVALGGTVVGGMLGFVTYKILQKLDDHLLETALTVVLAFGTPLAAEAFHFSGVIAVVVAGLVIGNYGKIYSMSPKTREVIENFWEVIDFIVNSLVFLLVGIELQVISQADFSRYFVPLLWGIFAVMISRAVVVYPVVQIQNVSQREKISGRWAHILFWGGLKGAIPIALVVGLPPGFEHRALFLTAAFGIVLFSLVVQGLTMTPLVRSLGLLEK